MESACNLCSMPDYVLIHISTFLNGIDLTNLAMASQRLSSICCEKHVVSCLDFSRCYRLTSATLKTFLAPGVRCRNVAVLNLNHCYWLHASELAKITKLVNLKELHVLDCAVSHHLLKKIIMKTRLNCLSFTWRRIESHEEADDVYSESEVVYFTNLKTVIIHIGFELFLHQIGWFLALCSNLQKLEIHENKSYALRPNDAMITICQRAVACGKLKSFHLSVNFKDRFKSYSIIDDMLKVRDDQQWEELYFEQMSCKILHHLILQKQFSMERIINMNVIAITGLHDPVYQHELELNEMFPMDVLRNQLKCSQLWLNYLPIKPALLHAVASHCSQLEILRMNSYSDVESSDGIFAGLKDICDSCHHITVLDLGLDHIHLRDGNPCEALANLKGLLRLRISACLVSSPKDTDGIVTSVNLKQGLGKTQRTGIPSAVTEPILQRSRLWILTVSCPNLTHLEIFGHKRNFGGCENIDGKALVCISRWKKLQYLSFSNLKCISSGGSLRDIAQNCPMLTTIKLREVNQLGVQCTSDLCTSLNYTKCLRNLSVCLPRVTLSRQFCQSLGNCLELERVALTIETSPRQEELNLFVQTVKKLSSLIMVYICFNGSEQIHKVIRRQLARVKAVREALSFIVDKDFNLQNMQKCPSVHMEEMILPTKAELAMN